MLGILLIMKICILNIAGYRGVRKKITTTMCLFLILGFLLFDLAAAVPCSM